MRKTESTIGLDRPLKFVTDSGNDSRAGESEPVCPDASRDSRPTHGDHGASAAIYSCGRRRRHHDGGPGLTRTVFNTLLQHLDPDRDIAGQQYERIRAKLLKFFECRGCEEPEELTDETINRVAARIEAGAEIWCADPISYFYGVARFVAREHRRGLARRPVSLDCLTQVDGYGGASVETEHLDRLKLEHELEYLNLALQTLGPNARRVLLAYYEGENGATIKNRAMLAESLGIRVSALRTCVHRMREKVRARVEELRSSIDH